MMRSPSSSTWISLAIWLGLTACFLGLVAVIALDDTLIYFNYAYNLVAGHGIAYDRRGIPSEGVTSLLYLLFLTPFEAMGSNLLQVAILTNLLALLGSIYFGIRMLVREGFIPPAQRLTATACLGLMYGAADVHAGTLLGTGLESYVGLWALMGFLDTAHRLLLSEEKKRLAGWLMGWAVLSYLIRPESILALGLVSLFVLKKSSTKISLLSWGGVGLLILGSYHLWKSWYFGDYFPTAFYRKIQPALFPGAYYVLDALVAYFFLPLGIGLLSWKKSLWQKPFLPLLLLVCLGQGIAIVLTDPLVGLGFRYLLGPIFLGWVALLGLVMKRSEERTFFRKKRPWLLLTTLLFSLILIPRYQQKPWQFFPKTDQVMNTHLYIEWGKDLRKKVAEIEQVKVVFGDVGGFAYGSHAVLIDPNGLTEMRIAHLFQEASQTKRAERMAAIILEERPDLIVLGRGSASPYWQPGRNTHGPLNEAAQLQYLQALQAAGYHSIGSLELYYPLQIAMHPESPHFEALWPVMKDFIREKGTPASGPLTILPREGMLSDTLRFPVYPYKNAPDPKGPDAR